MRHSRKGRRPDGSVWVRTHPVTLLHDHASPTHAHEWDQLTYAASGVVRVDTADASWIVPPYRAVWVPSNTPHAERMFAPVSVPTLYFAEGLATSLPRECCTVNVSNLLRELILHTSRVGALDRREPAHAPVIALLLDQLERASDVPLQLPMPRDPRAQRLASLLQASPADSAPVAKLARDVGASRRTIERLFERETRMTIGEWRRRLRLLHAVRLLSEGAPVTSVSMEAGYSSVSAFIAVFKKTFGTTPGRYATPESRIPNP